ncbi:hypothetical protein KL86PLE_40753 [uncultured Pleomorphomonas sp.]|uniref:Uncharacterized protein n=1 Tax=uncultured Pleomorphomonas sp. TaxID=442121 RepID=A0A212LHG7_9HYPH|nr:hypothetical protein KL86PLE_40753 [uncultured Pleomorphomonas sp.]
MLLERTLQEDCLPPHSEGKLD